MKLTPEDVLMALEQYATSKFGVVGSPTILLVAVDDIEEGSEFPPSSIEVNVITHK